MPESTQLASGHIDGRDLLQVILLKPGRDRPQLCQIIWPIRPTVVAASEFPNVAATAMRLLAEASVTLAATRVGKKP
jgi:hypothetical protein